MASKYFDKDRVKISKSDYKELLKLGRDYSLIRICTCGNVRISINWFGEFNTDMPDEYCFTYVIHIENMMVTGAFVKEPTRLGDYYAYESEADLAFVTLRSTLRKDSMGYIEVDTREAPKVEVDLTDFGKAPVSKNIPKTKGKNLGAW